MSTYLNRRLDYLKNRDRERESNLRSTSRINDIKSSQLLAQSRKTRIQTTKGEKRKAMLEKRVVNSFTELIGNKNEGEFKNSLVYNILVTNIMNHLIESGNCVNEEACLATARKMAAFVSDVMKETYRKQKVTQQVMTRTNSREDRSRLRVRETLPKIPEERTKKFTKPSTTELRKTPSMLQKRKDFASPSALLSKIDVKNRIKTAYSPSRPSSQGRGKADPSPAKSDASPAKANKEKLNNWLDEVSNRTKKWTDWIKDTVDKAESSKARVKSGESLKSVSEDWRKYVKDKKQETKALRESTSVIWKKDDKELFRKRGQESIEQWLLKNKLNPSNRDRSNYSVRSTSSESAQSLWSSRPPSSVFGGDSNMYKLKQMGMFR